MISELEYVGEIKGKKCAICKLVLEEDDEILFCPECETLYHEEHLLDWLTEHNDCPICGRDFSQEIEKYSLKNHSSRDVTKGYSVNLKQGEIKIHTPRNNTIFAFMGFAFIFAGIFCVMIFLPLITLLNPYPKVLLYSVSVCLILYFAFSTLVIKGTGMIRKTIANFWEDILFSREGIIVKSPGLPSKETLIEILAEDIHTIKLNSTTSKFQSYARKYHISLEITNHKNKTFNLGCLHTSTNRNQRDQIYNHLYSHIRNFYRIDSIESKTGIGNYIRKNIKFLILSGLIYAILEAGLILINYYFITV